MMIKKGEHLIEIIVMGILLKGKEHLRKKSYI